MRGLQHRAWVGTLRPDKVLTARAATLRWKASQAPAHGGVSQRSHWSRAFLCEVNDSRQSCRGRVAFARMASVEICADLVMKVCLSLLKELSMRNTYKKMIAISALALATSTAMAQSAYVG